MAEPLAQHTRVARDSAHYQSVKITDRDLVAALTDKLGATIVGYMTERDKSTVSRWRSGQNDVPDRAGQALRLVYQIFRMLEPLESDHTIRAWFIGMNPQLDDVSPAEAVQKGMHREVLGAARAFMAGG